MKREPSKMLTIPSFSTSPIKEYNIYISAEFSLFIRDKIQALNLSGLSLNIMHLTKYYPKSPVQARITLNSKYNKTGT